MSALQYVFGVILILLAVAVVFLVLKQEGKQKGLGGTIAGGQDTFLGKSRGKKSSIFLSKLTTVFSIVLVVIITALYIAQPNGNKIDYSILDKVNDSFTRTETTSEESTTEETEEESSEETEAESTTDDSTDSTTEESTEE